MDCAADRFLLSPHQQEMRGRNDQYLADTVDALETLGGQAHVQRIYREVSKLRRARGDNVPVHGKGGGVYRFNLPALDQYRRDRRVPTLEELLEGCSPTPAAPLVT